jgi:hypothetical protein
MTSIDPKKLIVGVLEKHTEGLTLISLAEFCGLHRHTATKYVKELMNDGTVFQRSVGVAKLCFLKEKVENQSDEKKLLDKLRESIIGNVPQLRIVAIVMFLTLLLSETVILAYQNTSLLNETNLSNIEGINTSPLTSSNYPNLSQNTDSLINISFDENTNLSVANISTVKNDSDNNLSVEVFDETVQEISETLQHMENGNESLVQPPNASGDASETSNETLEMPQKTPINLEIKLDYVKKVTRGGIITAKASVTNLDTLTARNVVLGWILPEGFEITLGDSKKSCGDLEPNNVCNSEVSLKTDVSTVLGTKNIKIVVNYE